MTTKAKKTPAKGRASAVGSGRLVSPFRVYVGQVNQTHVEVSARDEDEAREKGYRLWRREYAHAETLSVERLVPKVTDEKPRVRHPVEFENAELGDEG